MFWNVEAHCKFVDMHHIRSVAPFPPLERPSLNYGPAFEISPAGPLLLVSNDLRPAELGTFATVSFGATYPRKLPFEEGISNGHLREKPTSSVCPTEMAERQKGADCGKMALEGKFGEANSSRLKRSLWKDRLRLRGPNGVHDEFNSQPQLKTFAKLAKIVRGITPCGMGRPFA